MESINTSNTTNHSNQCIEQKNAWSLSIHLRLSPTMRTQIQHLWVMHSERVLTQNLPFSNSEGKSGERKFSLPTPSMSAASTGPGSPRRGPPPATKLATPISGACSPPHPRRGRAARSPPVPWPRAAPRRSAPPSRPSTGRRPRPHAWARCAPRAGRCRREERSGGRRGLERRPAQGQRGGREGDGRARCSAPASRWPPEEGRGRRRIPQQRIEAADLTVADSSATDSAAAPPWPPSRAAAAAGPLSSWWWGPRCRDDAKRPRHDAFLRSALPPTQNRCCVCLCCWRLFFHCASPILGLGHPLGELLEIA